MDRENLEVFKTLIVKELTRTELEERCYELYEKCILLTDELLNKSHLPQVSKCDEPVDRDTLIDHYATKLLSCYTKSGIIEQLKHLLSKVN